MPNRVIRPGDREGTPPVNGEFLQIIYEGEPVASGTMDVRDLAPSLLSIAELCQEVNRQLHGSESVISVRVKADFHRGSFGVEIELVRTVLEHLQNMFTATSSQTVKDIVEIIFSATGVIALLKALQGEQNPRTATLENGNIRIEVSGHNNHIDVTPPVYNLSKDQNVRKYVDGAVRPLKKEGMNQIEVKQRGRTLQTVKRQDAQYLLVEPQSEIAEDQSVHQVTRDAYLDIVKLSFRGDNKWSFGDGSGGLIPARIEDREFLERVNRHEYVFGKGDQLKVRLRTRTTKISGGRYQAEHSVVKVLDFIPSPQTDMFKGEKR
ncbi:MAG: hypothetical protein AB1411_13095 [Nitrospirota bacterium]